MMKDRRPRRGRVWLERALALAGILALGAFGLAWLDARHYQASARAELEAALGADTRPDSGVDVDGSGSTSAAPEASAEQGHDEEGPDQEGSVSQFRSPFGPSSSGTATRAPEGTAGRGGNGGSPEAAPRRGSRRSADRTGGSGAPLGLLEAPRIGLSVVVAEGVESSTLRRAAGHMPQTPRPGEAGNAAIAGHRDSHFLPLRDIVRGDELTLQTSRGKFRYEVEWVRIVEPTALEVIDPTDHPALTLITCYPFTYLGDAPHRFIVRARQVG